MLSGNSSSSASNMISSPSTSPSSSVSSSAAVYLSPPSSTSDIPAWLLSTLMEYISYAVILVGVFGIPGNILIIRTYTKIGFSDSINISYCALGVSDIFCIIFITWNAICFMPVFAESNLPIVASEIVIPTGGITSVIFIDTTAWITAFVSLERCLCVVFPLKVKNIVTPTRTIVIIVSIFTLTSIPFASIMYYLYTLEVRFDTERNATILGVRYRKSPTAVSVHNFNQVYKLVVMTLLPYTTILMCSVFLAVYLNRSVSWRFQNSGNVTNSNSLNIERKKRHRENTKEIRVAKTVLSIATAFLILGAVGCLRLLVSIIWPQFRPLGHYGETFRLVGRVGFLFSLSNSSVNFVIYYTMGTKFRQTVNDMFKSKTKWNDVSRKPLPRG
ncbi:chemosensory receptor B [Elysia marginata]|uniref:Chemosensory receptor B n=1 Tax=Elysia marginata TaxID=1093978 RepID=A0AAV4FXR8_9GAST|nr:chemosensory receptor B [Elysia marginata]